MPVKYAVNLTEEERDELLNLTKKGKNSSRVFKRAQILLLAEEGYQDGEIADILKVGELTVHRTMVHSTNRCRICVSDGRLIVFICGTKTPL